MEFSRQDYWSGLPFPTLGDLPSPEIEPRSPIWQAGSLPTEPPGKLTADLWHCQNMTVLVQGKTLTNQQLGRNRGLGKKNLVVCKLLEPSRG